MHFSFSHSTVLYIDTCVNVQGLHMSSLPGYVVSSFLSGMLWPMQVSASIRWAGRPDA